MPARATKLSVAKILAVASLGVAVFLITPNESSPPDSETIPPQLPAETMQAAPSNPSKTVDPSPGFEREGSTMRANHNPSVLPTPKTPIGASPVTTPPRAPYQPPSSKYKNARNPAARQALAGVGKDVESEKIWLEAINDPTLPANERQDLIEDLNEDGISNPAQPTDRDLTLIKSRIALIANLLSDAMDETNAAAFKEAQKDLLNMLKRLER